MAYMDLLFAGVPKGPVRAFLAEAVRRHKPRAVVIPCTGSFALAETAVQGGIHPTRIITGDISLYSTVIGHMLQGSEITITVQGAGERVADYLTDPISKAAAVLYMVRWCQTQKKPQNAYWIDRLRDLEVGQSDYIESLRLQLTELKTRLDGVEYRAVDLWETIADYQNDPQAMIWLDPPWYAHGYEKMFAGLDDCFIWPKPTVPQFDPKQYAKLMEIMAAAPARTYVLYPTAGIDPAEEFKAPWRSAFGLKTGGGTKAAAIWAMCNQDDETGIDGQSLPRVKGPRFKLFDGEVKPDSVVFGLYVPTETGDHYRDLLVHNLNSGGVEAYAALLLDGQLFAILGLHNIQSMFMGGPDRTSVHIVFHFPVHHPKYPKLGKLMMLCLCCRWLWEDVLLAAYPKLELIGLPTEIQTTMITDKPSSMLTRGTTLKLVEREFDKKLGKNMLNYRGAIIPMSRTEVVSLWLRKYAM